MRTTRIPFRFRAARAALLLVAAGLASTGCGYTRVGATDGSVGTVDDRPHGTSGTVPPVGRETTVGRQPDKSGPTRDIEPDLDTSEARRVVAVLADSSMYGRGYTHHGADRASRFLVSGFQSIGVRPLVDGYLQPFPLEVDLIHDVAFSMDGEPAVPGVDFIPYSGIPSAAAMSVATIDAGYGLELFAPPGSRGLERLKQKAVVVRSGLPDSLKADLPPELGSVEAKAFGAAAHGAAALVVRSENLVFGRSHANSPIPVFEISLAAPIPESIGFLVESVVDTMVTTANVLGYLPPNQPTSSDSLILIGAHYDHEGSIGSAYFPGANDNASGTAMLLDLARALASSNRRLGVVFAAFSGEEEGLFGSRAFVASPPVPLERIGLVVNLDMVASADDGVVVMGGIEQSDAFAAIREIGGNLDAALGDSAGHAIRARRVSAISDHFPFAEIGVPALYFYTNKGRQPYHHVRDVPATLEWDDYAFTRELILGFLRTRLN